MRSPLLVALALLSMACHGPETDPGGAGGGGVICSTDEDGDGWIAAECGGEDCCDSDHGTRPDFEGWGDRPSLCGGWDRDCDGAVAFERPSGLAYCSPILPPLETAAECTAADAGQEPGEYGWPSAGWAEAAPGCGETAEWWYSCEWTADMCGPSQSLPLMQRCR